MEAQVKIYMDVCCLNRPMGEGDYTKERSALLKNTTMHDIETELKSLKGSSS